MNLRTFRFPSVATANRVRDSHPPEGAAVFAWHVGPFGGSARCEQALVLNGRFVQYGSFGTKVLEGVTHWQFESAERAEPNARRVVSAPGIFGAQPVALA